MKKNKRKALLKSVRKAVREDIKQNLVAQLKEVAEKFGHNNKKFGKEIEKGSKQLAKKLSKEFKIKGVVLPETGNKIEVQTSANVVSNQELVEFAPAKPVAANKPLPKSASKPKKVQVETV